MKANPIKIAVLSTEFHPVSHTDVIVSRWLEPFPSDSLYGWSAPSSRIASFYIAQRKLTSDLTNAVTARYGIPCFDSIAEALTLGGGGCRDAHRGARGLSRKRVPSETLPP